MEKGPQKAGIEIAGGGLAWPGGRRPRSWSWRWPLAGPWASGCWRKRARIHSRSSYDIVHPLEGDMPKQIVFAIVTFFHDLFTVVWVGGLITLGVVVLPAARKALGMGPDTKKLMDAIQKRLSVLVYVSIVGLLLTGLLLSRRAPAFQGLFSFGNTYSLVLGIKHVLTLLMIAVTLLRSIALRRATGQPQERLKAGLLFLNLALGILVLVLSGLSAAFSQGG